MSLILFAGFVVYSIYPIIFSFGKTNIEIINDCMAIGTIAPPLFKLSVEYLVEKVFRFVSGRAKITMKSE